jgi:hypothetical protein
MRKNLRFPSQALEMIQDEIKCLRSMERRVSPPLTVLNAVLRILIHSSEMADYKKGF